MTGDSDRPERDEESEPPAPTRDRRHPLAGAGEPVSEEEAQQNRDRDPPA